VDRRGWPPSAAPPAQGRRARRCWPDRSGFSGEAEHPHSFQDAQGAERDAVRRVFRRLKANRHVALGAQVVDLIGLHLLDDPDQVGAVCEVTVVEHQARIALMRVLVEVIDPGGVEAAGPPLVAVRLLRRRSLLEEKQLPCTK
jgi:hypothetical protein